MKVAPKVAISIPFYKHIEGPTLYSCMDLAMRSAATCGMLPIMSTGCYVEDTRNGAVQYALNTGIEFDWFLWVDADMIFPGDALLRLLEHDKDIVGANYRTRTPPYSFAGIYDGESLNREPGAEKLLAPGLHRMVQMPCGLLLTRFDIYRKMGYPWFKPGLHSEPRDDIYFCRKAGALGYEIWCDHDLTKQVRHIATQEIPWFAPEQLVEVQAGAQIDLVKGQAAAKHRAELSRREFDAAIAAE